MTEISVICETSATVQKNKKKHRRKQKRKAEDEVEVQEVVGDEVLMESSVQPVVGDQEDQLQTEQTHFGLVHEDKKTYFKSIEKMFASKNNSNSDNGNENGGNDHRVSEMSEDERDAFLRGIYAEIDGFELRLSSDPDCSRVLESILSISDQFYVRVFLDRLAGSYSEMCTHRFASHVVQCLLHLIAKFNEDEMANKEIKNDDTQSDGESSSLLPISEMFGMICRDELLPSVQHLMANPYGSHILRLTLLLLSGRTYSDTSAGSIKNKAAAVRSKQSQEYKIKHDIHNCDEIPAGYKPRPGYKTIFDQFNGRICEIMTPTVIRLFSTHKVANPILQMIIRLNQLSVYSIDSINGENSNNNDQLIRRVFCLNSSDGNDDQEEDRKFIAMLCMEPAGSHLIQTCLDSAPTSCQSQMQPLLPAIYKKYFSHPSTIRDLANDKIGNYVLQSVIAKCPDEPSLMAIYTGLKDSIAQFIFRGRVNIIIKLVDASASLNVDDLKRSLFEGIKSAFKYEGGGDVSVKDFIHQILCLSKDPVNRNDESWKGIQSGGASLLAALCQISDVITTDGILKLEYSDLKMVAMDQNGCRCLEAILHSYPHAISFKFRSQLTKRLCSFLIDLSLSQNGSRIVDGVWKIADISQKEVICRMLVGRKEELSGNYFGRIILRNCKLVDYQRNKKEWTQSQKRQKANNL